MIKGKEKTKEKLSKELILSKIDDYNIYKYYLGQDINFRKKYHSPFRKDKTPNLTFFLKPDKSIGFKDFSDGKTGDCFQFVEYLFNINYFEAMCKIDQDFGLGLMSGSTTKFKVNLVKKPDFTHQQAQKLIQIISKPFTQEELDYWESFYITQVELFNHNIHSVNKLYVNKRLIPNIEKDMRFAYVFDKYIKIYSPLSKVMKWISSCPNDYISGFDTIKHKIFTGRQADKLIISKSVKDEIVLSKFFKDVCSTQNESTGAINEEDMEIILKGYEPEDVYMAYDSDEAGVRASTYFTKKYGFKWINIPKVFMREGIKDWADLAKLKGLDTMENYLKIKKLI